MIIILILRNLLSIVSYNYSIFEIKGYIVKGYLFIAIMAYASLLNADYILKYKMDTELQTFMYHSDKSSKMINTSGGEKSELYKIGKKTYVVSFNGGKKTVVDMDEMKKMSQSMGYDASAHQQKIQKPVYKITKTSKRINVGNIKGEIWVISGEEDGEKFKEEIVVTNDKRVVKSVRAMMNLFSSMSGASLENDFLEPEKGYVTIKADGMELKYFKDQRISSDEYQLPKGVKEQKIPDFAKMKTKALNSCYEKVCCGKTSGESKVLASALKNSFKGYKLIGSGVCDALGVSSLLGMDSVEGALYKKGDDYIQVSLNMDDTEGGILRKTKKNLDSGYSTGMVSGIKNYSEKKKVNGVKVVQGELLPMKQETFEYIIDSKTILTISRIRKNNNGIPLMKVVSSSGGVNLEKLQNSLKTIKSSKPTKTKPEDVDVDQAVNLLKSFF